MASMTRPVAVLSAAMIVFIVIAFATSATAHPLAPSLLEIVEAAPGHADVRWKTPANKMPGATMRPVLPPHCVLSGTPVEEAVDTAIVRKWGVACSALLTGSTISVEGIAASKADVILRVALSDGRVFNTVLTAEHPSYVVPARESPLAVMRSYLSLGVEHILTGADHLLFVLGLMLLVSTRRQLIWTVTAFTAGHSVTLSLATLGFVNVPSAPVEALIAFSILVVAVEVARGTDAPPTLMRRFPWAIAFAFGLLHGFGFAGALSEIGLPAGEIPLALLSFNLGIETGQLVFCALGLVLYAIARRLRLVRPVRMRWATAYLIGTLAAFWFFERAAASFVPA
jgi:hydrogenase/urease accessory protein HupE